MLKLKQASKRGGNQPLDFLLFPFVFSILVILIVVIAAVISIAKSGKQQQSHLYRSQRGQTYVPGEFNGQMELDLRLPYRRFRQLYPASRLTYEEYKQLQMRSAFRRSLSSQENKRMVR
ncbi:MAG: hypothetical protein N3D85_03625 [Candidatus Bathyarchaeota archaeon]|nr:hypothetical protein [Candidatus Bathyarchaeota archaeon]